MTPVISFVGRHNAGKTTVLEGVIQYLSSAGLKVALIKHAHHKLDIKPVKDAEILFQAGADYVLAASPGISLQYRRHSQDPSLQQILTAVPKDMDLIIVEGFKQEALDKIEIIRAEIDPEPMLLPKTAALVADFKLNSDIPVFKPQQVQEIAAYILKITGLKSFVQE